jgi:hypothetical protein
MAICFHCLEEKREKVIKLSCLIQVDTEQLLQKCPVESIHQVVLLFLTLLLLDVNVTLLGFKHLPGMFSEGK